MDYDRKKFKGRTFLVKPDYEMFMDYCKIVMDIPDEQFDLQMIIKKIADKYQVYTKDNVAYKIQRAMKYELEDPRLPMALCTPYQKVWYNNKKQ